MMLEDCPASKRPVRCAESFFRVFPEFVGSSYKRRYDILLTKLVRERLYDAASFLLSSAETGPQGDYEEPSPELGFRNFVTSLLGRARAVAKEQA